jgi:hypothetical protein
MEQGFADAAVDRLRIRDRMEQGFPEVVNSRDWDENNSTATARPRFSGAF